VSISVCVLHNPRHLDRVACLEEMSYGLFHADAMHIVDRIKPEGEDWHRFKVTLFDEAWRWSLEETDCTHHLFLTDDLYLAPRFLACLRAMVDARPHDVIGLLANHPRAIELYDAGERWYRTSSWVVGPAYLMPRAHLRRFHRWWSDIPRAPEGVASNQYPPGRWREYWNDDCAINEWVMRHGPGTAYHPLPTIVEHRGDLPSTCGHGDKTSRQRVSWRQKQWWVDDATVPSGWRWTSTLLDRSDVSRMVDPVYWSAGAAPLLLVEGE
jgi:hypothetical protein